MRVIAGGVERVGGSQDIEAGGVVVRGAIGDGEVPQLHPCGHSTVCRRCRPGEEATSSVGRCQASVLWKPPDRDSEVAVAGAEVRTAAGNAALVVGRGLRRRER
jgi:hypothetical protein